MSSTGIENCPPVTDPALGREAPVKGLKTEVTTGKKSGKSSGRKSLKTLQPSGKNQMLLVGSDGMVRISSSGKKDFKIYHDESPPLTSTPERVESVSRLVQVSVETISISTQVEEKDTAQAQAEQMMYCEEEELTVEYWKDLAEKRREALEVSLTENESLHTSLSLIEEERDRLKDENTTFKSMVEQASELASMLNAIASDDDDDDEAGAEDEAHENNEENQQAKE